MGAIFFPVITGSFSAPKPDPILNQNINETLKATLEKLTLPFPYI